MSFVSVRVLHKKQPSDRIVDSSVGSPRAPQLQSCFFRVVPHRPSEKTAIHVRYVHPFSVATLKWGLEGATTVRSLSGGMAVFFEPGIIIIWADIWDPAPHKKNVNRNRREIGKSLQFTPSTCEAKRIVGTMAKAR